MIINRNDNLLLLHNGIVIDCGVAHTVRGFNQDKIASAWYNGNYGEISRDGVFEDPTYSIRVVTLAEWDNERARFEQIKEEKLKLERQSELQKEVEYVAQIDAAEKWLETLTPQEQKFVDILNREFFNECRD